MLRQEINLYRSYQAQPTNASFLTWKRYWILNALAAIIMLIVGMTTIIGNHINKNILLENELKLTQTANNKCVIIVFLSKSYTIC